MRIHRAAVAMNSYEFASHTLSSASPPHLSGKLILSIANQLGQYIALRLRTNHRVSAKRNSNELAVLKRYQFAF